MTYFLVLFGFLKLSKFCVAVFILLCMTEYSNRCSTIPELFQLALCCLPHSTLTTKLLDNGLCFAVLIIVHNRPEIKKRYLQYCTVRPVTSWGMLWQSGEISLNCSHTVNATNRQVTVKKQANRIKQQNHKRANSISDKPYKGTNLLRTNSFKETST